MFNRKPTDLLGSVGRALLDAGETYVYVVDLDFNVIHLSKALTEFTGLGADCGLSVHELAEHIYADKPEYQRAIRKIHEGWARSEHIRGVSLLLKGRDGALVTAR